MKNASAGPRVMSIDPACGHAVDTSEARASGRTSEYRGTTYYFCSSECKKTFDKDPERAFSKTVQSMDQPASGGSRHD
jgi:YHS domain-containing protein